VPCGGRPYRVHELARSHGEDPAAFRRRNLLREGDIAPVGTPMHSAGFVGCLAAVTAAIGWDRPRAARRPLRPRARRRRRPGCGSRSGTRPAGPGRPARRRGRAVDRLIRPLSLPVPGALRLSGGATPTLSPAAARGPGPPGSAIVVEFPDPGQREVAGCRGAAVRILRWPTCWTRRSQSGGPTSSAASTRPNGVINLRASHTYSMTEPFRKLNLALGSDPRAAAATTTSPT
jgi:hypothetical protein